ncbi:MAG: TonB-dependent receptor [Cytophagales bacterium]|nr:TonB-dependent receptor [Cytophagales bacterium]
MKVPLLSCHVLLAGVLAGGFSGFAPAQSLAVAGGAGPRHLLHGPEQNQKSLQEVLTALETRYRVYLNYEFSLVENKFVPEKVIRGNCSLEEILRLLLEPLQLRYEKIEKNYYVIYAAEAPPPGRPDASSGASSSSGAASRGPDVAALTAAAVTVSGTVRAGDGNALPGVNVLLKGTATGTTTDVDGRYALTVPDGTGTLVFSYIGYVTEEVALGNRTTLDVVLVADIKSLGEVVVVGYGTQTKKDVTGAITSVKAADIRNIPVSQADALLQGKAAGVQVVQNSGTPGGEVFVRVRGTASLRADSRPLYVIDGVPMNNVSGTVLDAGGQRTSALADINPNDIESMEILKDAAATAIYGARGSNGVVLITTKRGKEGRATFSFDAFYGVQEVWKEYDLLNGEQFSETLTDAITNRNAISPTSGQTNLNSPQYVSALAVTGANTNYQDEIFRSAPMSSYNLSVNGGQDKIRTYASLGVYNQLGTLTGQEYRRITGRVNLDYQATDKLKFGTSTTYSNAQTARVTNDFSGVSVLANALLRNPNLPVRNEDGSYSVDPLGRNGTENPVMLAREITFNDNQKRLIANVYGEYTILEGLTFRSVFGLDNLGTRLERFVPSFVLATQGSAQAQAVSSESFTWLNDNTLTLNRSFGSHRVTALAGLGLQKNRTSFLQAGGNTAGSDIITTVAVAVPDVPSHNISDWALLSYFGRANYSFKDKYIIEGSFRVDGSSRFGKNKRFGTFPALSVAWRLIEEPFLQNAAFLADLKLRAGIGTTGNQEGLPNFGSLTLYGTGRNYDGRPGIAKSNVPNPDLGWESTTTTNVGIDVAFFNGRITVTADAYLKKTKDLLFTRQLPWTSGFEFIPNENVGTMENKGLEFALSTQNLVGAVKWTTDFNISFNRNKITSLPQNGSAGSDFIFKLPDAYSVEGPYSIYRVGQPVGSFYGYQYQGVYSSDEDVPENLKDPNSVLNSYRGGYPILLDADGNGQYERQFDRVLIGNALPLHTGGITNTFSYKGLQLSVFLNWSYGNDIYNITRAVLTSMADDFNQSTEVLNRWRQPGDVTNVPRAIYIANSFRGASFTDASSRFIEDGSFLRVRNVTFGYNLPAALLGRVKLSTARVYVTGQNLWTFTRYSGLDPENQNTGGGLVPTLGVDYLTQPQPRVYTLGLNVGF